MKAKIIFVERKFWEYVSIEKVFRQIEKHISKEKFDCSFRQMPYGNSLTAIIKNLLFFRPPPADVYHITGHIHYMALVLPKRKTILTIHDLGFMNTRKGLRRFALKKLFVDFPLKRAGYITAISEATKKEIVQYTGCEAGKIRVVENPLQDVYKPDAKKNFDYRCPTILQIGTAHNKNLLNLIKALHGISCTLVIIGKLERKIVDALAEHQIRFENRYDLSDTDVKAEYQRADVLTFCSTFEGFGLPVIEAQAMGTPVVTSNISPLTEVAGDAAHFVDPKDFNSIRKGILKVLNDDFYRENLIAAGTENVKRFEAKNAAFRYENLYGEVLKANVEN